MIGPYATKTLVLLGAFALLALNVYVVTELDPCTAFLLFICDLFLALWMLTWWNRATRLQKGLPPPGTKNRECSAEEGRDA